MKIKRTAKQLNPCVGIPVLCFVAAQNDPFSANVLLDSGYNHVGSGYFDCTIGKRQASAVEGLGNGDRWILKLGGVFFGICLVCIGEDAIGKALNALLGKFTEFVSVFLPIVIGVDCASQNRAGELGAVRIKAVSGVGCNTDSARLIG